MANLNYLHSISTRSLFIDNEDSLLCDSLPREIELNKTCRDELDSIKEATFTHSVILHIPHASTNIPPRVKDQFLLNEEELQHEQLKMVDRYADELFMHKEYPHISCPVSRLVCDVERFSDDEKEPMALVGMAMVYVKTHDGKRLRRELKDYEKKELFEKYHQPNERDVQAAVIKALRVNGVAIVLDCHTFPSVPHLFEKDQAVPRVDICIGVDTFHTPGILIELVHSFFIEKGYTVSLNSPYEGTYIPSHFYHRNKNCLSIMIEVNRSLYMNELTGEKLKSFNIMHLLLATLIESVDNLLVENYIS